MSARRGDHNHLTGPSRDDCPCCQRIRETLGVTSRPLPVPAIELWCRDCEGHVQDGRPCRPGPRGFGCCVKSHWRQPRRLVDDREAALCRTIGHTVREEVREALDIPVPPRPGRSVFLDRVR